MSSDASHHGGGEGANSIVKEEGQKHFEPAGRERKEQEQGEERREGREEERKEGHEEERREGHEGERREECAEERKDEHEEERKDEHKEERRDGHEEERRDGHEEERRDGHEEERRGVHEEERREGHEEERRDGHEEERRDGHEEVEVKESREEAEQEVSERREEAGGHEEVDVKESKEEAGQKVSEKREEIDGAQVHSAVVSAGIQERTENEQAAAASPKEEGDTSGNSGVEDVSESAEAGSGQEAEPKAVSRQDSLLRDLRERREEAQDAMENAVTQEEVEESRGREGMEKEEALGWKEILTNCEANFSRVMLATDEGQTRHRYKEDYDRWCLGTSEEEARLLIVKEMEGAMEQLRENRTEMSKKESSLSQEVVYEWLSRTKSFKLPELCKDEDVGFVQGVLMDAQAKFRTDIIKGWWVGHRTMELYLEHFKSRRMLMKVAANRRQKIMDEVAEARKEFAYQIATSFTLTVTTMSQNYHRQDIEHQFTQEHALWDLILNEFRTRVSMIKHERQATQVHVHLFAKELAAIEEEHNPQSLEDHVRGIQRNMQSHKESVHRTEIVDEEVKDWRLPRILGGEILDRIQAIQQEAKAWAVIGALEWASLNGMVRTIRMDEDDVRDANEQEYDEYMKMSEIDFEALQTLNQTFAEERQQADILQVQWGEYLGRCHTTLHEDLLWREMMGRHGMEVDQDRRLLETFVDYEDFYRAIVKDQMEREGKILHLLNAEMVQRRCIEAECPLFNVSEVELESMAVINEVLLEEESVAQQITIQHKAIQSQVAITNEETMYGASLFLIAEEIRLRSSMKTEWQNQYELSILTQESLNRAADIYNDEKESHKWQLLIPNEMRGRVRIEEATDGWIIEAIEEKERLQIYTVHYYMTWRWREEFWDLNERWNIMRREAKHLSVIKMMYQAFLTAADNQFKSSIELQGQEFHARHAIRHDENVDFLKIRIVDEEDECRAEIYYEEWMVRGQLTLIQLEHESRQYILEWEESMPVRSKLRTSAMESQVREEIELEFDFQMSLAQIEKECLHLKNRLVWDFEETTCLPALITVEFVERNRMKQRQAEETDQMDMRMEAYNAYVILCCEENEMARRLELFHRNIIERRQIEYEGLLGFHVTLMQQTELLLRTRICASEDREWQPCNLQLEDILGRAVLRQEEARTRSDLFTNACHGIVQIHMRQAPLMEFQREETRRRLKFAERIAAQIKTYGVQNDERLWRISLCDDEARSRNAIAIACQNQKSIASTRELRLNQAMAHHAGHHGGHHGGHHAKSILKKGHLPTLAMETLSMATHRNGILNAVGVATKKEPPNRKYLANQDLDSAPQRAAKKRLSTLLAPAAEQQTLQPLSPQGIYLNMRGTTTHERNSTILVDKQSRGAGISNTSRLSAPDLHLSSLSLDATIDPPPTNAWSGALHSFCDEVDTVIRRSDEQQELSQRPIVYFPPERQNEFIPSRMVFM